MNQMTISELEDQEDEFYAYGFDHDEGDNMNEVFQVKLIINTLKHWKGGYAEESFLRTLLDRCPGQATQVTAWPMRIKKMEEEWREQSTDLFSGYVSYGKFLTNDDIHELIINPLVKECPAYDEAFPLTQTCRTIAGLLDCTPEETLFLQLAIDFRNLGYPFDVLIPRIGNCFDNKIDMYAAILNISKTAVKDIIDGFLVKSGFIIPSTYPEGFYVLATVFDNAFRDKNIRPEDVEGLLFPNTLETDLSLDDDYEHIKEDVTRSEKIIGNALANKVKGTNILFWGPAGTGKTELAVAMAKKNGWQIRSIGDISETDNQEKSRSDRLGNLKIALKLFNEDGKTVLLFDEIEDLFKVDNTASFSKAFINRIIETTTVPIIWTTNSLIELGSPVLRRMTYNIHCTTPSKKARRVMWEKYAGKFGVALDDDTREMLDSFDISPALIKSTMQVTGTALASEGAAAKSEDVRAIVTSLDRLVNYGEKRKFTPVEKDDPYYDVSCVNTEHDLTHFTGQLVNATSPAFALCLYGPPGTGKSQYGRYLARQMGKKVLFKRASDLQSMWVGECEKNIARAFEQAKEENLVLIIDEGDSFLQNRGGAQRSYEVSQVNEMLSQMEDHPEPFIITTNLMDNLDPASLRRFTFKMKFDYLTPLQSVRLFERYYKVAPPARIKNNHLLTPGDISCVHKQVKILGIHDGEAIYKMIEKECSMKPNYRNSIGF